MAASNSKKTSRRSKLQNDSSKTVALNCGNATQRPLKRLLSVQRPPVFELPSMSNEKGKAKGVQLAKSKAINLADGVADVAGHEMWVDKYEPKTEADLAVHQKKVENVRRWLEEAFNGGLSGNLKKYRKALILTGPAGSGKTTTIRILSKEMKFDLVEWKNSFDDRFREDEFYDRESLIQKFDSFLFRASTCKTLPHGPSTSAATMDVTKKIILVEDLPNILHPETQEAFHTSLLNFVNREQSTPVVIVISDASTRADARDEKIASGGAHRSMDVIDIRTVIPRELLRGPFVDEINFNPVAPTLMLRALQALLKTHFTSSSSRTYHRQPRKEELDIIVESSNGDIRSAIMVLQFSCLSNQTKSKIPTTGSRALLEAVTRREQSLHLFHLLGRVLYNKRKKDPPNPSASAKDRKREQELDARLDEPPPIAPWHSDHHRRTSRVDVDTLYADAPVDTGLLSLYIHQNYTQFCNSLEECEALCDWFSWIDSSGGEQWYQANPYQFHILTLGALHALPSPVPRRSQKLFKPAFFDVLKRTREAEDAVSDVRLWVQESCASYSQMPSGGWTSESVALDLGAVLRAYTTKGSNRPPPHAPFSLLKHHSPSGLDGGALDDTENGYDQTFVDLNDRNDASWSDWRARDRLGDEEEVQGSWLEADDIEDF